MDDSKRTLGHEEQVIAKVASRHYCPKPGTLSQALDFGQERSFTCNEFSPAWRWS
jgi:hypothetical protein